MATRVTFPWNVKRNPGLESSMCYLGLVWETGTRPNGSFRNGTFGAQATVTILVTDTSGPKVKSFYASCVT